MAVMAAAMGSPNKNAADTVLKKQLATAGGTQLPRKPLMRRDVGDAGTWGGAPAYMRQGSTSGGPNAMGQRQMQGQGYGAMKQGYQQANPWGGPQPANTTSGIRTSQYPGGGGGQYPGQTNWWQQGGFAPPQSQNQYGSTQFNYQGGNIGMSQAPQSPWGQQSGGQQGYGQQSGGQQGYGQQGGGMPQGGMPSYQGQQYQNSAYPELQQRISEQNMLNQMPSRLAQQYQFNQGAQGMGYDPSQMSGQGQMFQGYGQQWGSNPYGWTGGSGAQGSPWSGTWGAQTPGQAPVQQGQNQNVQRSWYQQPYGVGWRYGMR